MSRVFLHRGAAPRTPAELAGLTRDKDAVYCRGLSPIEVAYLERELAPIRAQNELRRLRERRIGFNPRVRWGEWLVVCLVFGVICFAWVIA